MSFREYKGELDDQKAESIQSQSYEFFESDSHRKREIKRDLKDKQGYDPNIMTKILDAQKAVGISVFKIHKTTGVHCTTITRYLKKMKI